MKANTKHYCIKEPYWKIKGFGLSEANMGKRKTIVSVKLKKNDGSPTFNNSFVIKTKDAMKHDFEYKGGTKLYLIPFADCKEIPRPKKAKRCK
jgi:transcription initiation factor IIE alpha subunit